MNLFQLRSFFVAVFLLCASLGAGANELTIAGKSAQDTFNDEGVVNLLKAAINGDSSKAKHLIASGVNVNAFGEGGVTPLLWAELKRDADAMKLLLDLGADPNKYVLPGVGNTGFGPPVWMAAGAGQKKMLQVLLEHGGDPNLVFGNDSSLMMAVSGSHIDCADLLLRHGADINLSVGPMSALTETMTHVQFGDAVWVLNHGFMHNLPLARRMLVRNNPRPGQEVMKVQALQIIDRLIATQQKN